MTTTISKAYPRGAGRWACKVKTLGGDWRWCPRADSPEEALAAAEFAQNVAEEAVPIQEGPYPCSPESGSSAGFRLFLPEHENPLLEAPKTTKAEPSQESAHGLKIKPARGGGPQTRNTSGPSGVRLQGPHPHEGGGFRYRIITSAGRTWAATGRTEVQALKLAEAAVAKHAKLDSITVKDALDNYVRYKERCGVQPSTHATMRNGVRTFFRSVLGTPLSRITQRVCQQQYDLLQQAVDPRTGRTISVATHRAYLAISRGFFRWVAEQGWVAESPIEKVRGVGRRRRGKIQLTLDEAHRLSLTCRAEAARGHEGATATLLCMHMGLRASEALSRVVRDIDKEGTILRIDDNTGTAFRLKTGSSKRAPKIPTFLRPILAAMATGKVPTDPLFPGSLGGRRRRQWLNVQLERLCAMAGVPVVCPHSLRGIFATAAASAGESPELVAQILGHSDSSMTVNHYIAPGTLQDLHSSN